jgi:hypothetical protein
MSVRSEGRGGFNPAGARAGASLLEALLALFAGGVMIASVAGLVRADERLAYARAGRLARGETVRVAAAVLQRELGATVGADIRATGRDSIALRLFRGIAVTCAAPVGAAVRVRFLGARAPDPARDSLLSLAGPWSPPLPVLSVAPGTGCAGAAAPAAAPGVVHNDLTLELPADATPGIGPGTPLLLFQSGTYALSEAAFRVRHGGEGRQPLTGEWLDVRFSAFGFPADTIGLAHLDVALAFKATPVRRRLRLPLRNAAPTGAEMLP